MEDNTSTEAVAETQATDTTNTGSTDMDAALIADDDEQESTPAQPKVESTDETKDEASEDTEESESEEAEQTDGEDAEAEESDESDKPSDDPKEQARRAYEQREAQRQARNAEVQQQNNQLNEYVQEAETPEQQAFRQLQVESYQNRVQMNESKLVTGYERAISSIETFKNPTPEVQRMLDKAIDNFQAKHVEIDANGNPYKVEGDIYQYLQSEAKDIEALTQTGARQENQNRAKSRGNAMTPPARAKPAPKVDPIMAELLKDD